MITLEQLEAIMPQSRASRRQEFLAPLNAAMNVYGIYTAWRAAAFLAQIAHESGQLTYVAELWGPTAQQRKYDPPSQVATDLGNVVDGDGFRFRGRGLIQITGRKNYSACSLALFGAAETLLYNPARLEEPEYAARSAGWFWQVRGLNDLADQGRAGFKMVTKRINGGYNGLAERELFYDRALKCMRLGAPTTTPAPVPSPLAGEG
jgi:putative chitinase